MTGTEVSDESVVRVRRHAMTYVCAQASCAVIECGSAGVVRFCVCVALLADPKFEGISDIAAAQAWSGCRACVRMRR